MRKMKKLLAATMALTMLVSATGITACDFGGSRELTSIVIKNGSVDTSYTLNETVSFEDIVITAKYNDASTEGIDFSKVKVFLNGEDITANLNKITESVGTKIVTIEYAGKSATLKITVSSSVGGGGTELPSEPASVEEYGTPRAYLTHLSKRNEAGTAQYGDEGFKSQFMKGTDMYTAGDDNDFQFLPLLTFFNEADELEDATTFPSKTVVSLYSGTEYGALTSREKEGEAGVVEYFAEDTVYLTANVMNNTYNFTEDAIDKQFKLSVRPDENYYDLRESAPSVECELTVVDGFNVYNAKQLGVIDNEGPQHGPNEERAGAWDDIKEAEGLTGVNPAAVILQNDITVTKDDIPAKLKYTLNEDVFYYAADDTKLEFPQKGEKTFLYDCRDGTTNILRRYIGENETFKIYGNYYTINLTQAPLVSSFANEYEKEGYGNDFSNANFLKIYGAAESSKFEMVNLEVRGNAQSPDAKSLVSIENNNKKPVDAGGLIFIKMEKCDATLDNVVARTFFITFFPDGEGANVTLKNSKAYDSYQNAAFVWDRNAFTMENCNLEGAGGPLIIAQHVDSEKEEGANKYSTITADDNTILKNFLSGGEFWFTEVVPGAAALIKNLQTMDSSIFQKFPVPKTIYTKTEANGEDKFNFIILLMSNGTGTDAIANINVQGSFEYKGYALDRVKTSAIGQATHAGIINSYVSGNGVKDFIPVTFNVKETNGYLTGSNSVVWSPDQTTAVTQFIQGEYLSLNMGGFGLFFEFFNKAQ